MNEKTDGRSRWAEGFQEGSGNSGEQTELKPSGQLGIVGQSLMYTLGGQVTGQEGYYITLIVLGVHLLMGVTLFPWPGVSNKN